METRDVGISVQSRTVPTTVIVEMTLPVARTFRNVLAILAGVQKRQVGRILTNFGKLLMTRGLIVRMKRSMELFG